MFFAIYDGLTPRPSAASATAALLHSNSVMARIPQRYCCHHHGLI
jgi:hypothetical protein